MIPIWKMAGWIAPLGVLTPGLPEPPKNRGQAEPALGRSRGGFRTKIQVTVDGLGDRLRWQLTAGERQDLIQAHDWSADLDFDFVIADRSSGAQAFVNAILASGAEPVIPPKQTAKAPREYDQGRYRERHLVEGFIAKIKPFRRVFSRFDQLAKRYLGFLHFVSSLIWLR
jgi:transposase